MRMWSIGCVVAGMTFHQRDNHDQIVDITNVLSTQGLYEYIKQCDLCLVAAIESILPVVKENHGHNL